MKQLEVTTTLMEGYRVLTYRYDANQYLGFKFHLLSEVGAPWQSEAKAMQRALLKPGEQVVQVELSTKPWYVDAIVKETV